MPTDVLYAFRIPGIACQNFTDRLLPRLNKPSRRLKGMQNRNSPLTPEIWLHDLFTSKAVQQGGVIRRKARDIERFAGMDLFMREIHRRGYQVAENSGQLVIFCNRAPVRWLTHGHQTPISSKEIGQKSFEDFGASDERRLSGGDDPAGIAVTPRSV